MAESESVFFYTFHKCASTLFSEYVLQNVTGLRNVDYAAWLWQGGALDTIVFERYGVVYGPIRLSAGPLSRIWSLLVEPCSREEFIRDRIGVFLVRDPRDIIVSMYYSFGFSHTLSPDPVIRARQEKRRATIQQQSIDEYALMNAARIRANFETAVRLLAACPRGVLLRYEDMIHDWPVFSAGLARYLELLPAVLAEIRARSAPRKTEDADSHRRSGLTGGHRTKLQLSTITALDAELGPVLEAFGYVNGSAGEAAQR